MELYVVDAVGRVEALDRWPEVSGQQDQIPDLTVNILTLAGVMNNSQYATAVYQQMEGDIQGPLFRGPITLVMGKYARIILNLDKNFLSLSQDIKNHLCVKQSQP